MTDRLFTAALTFILLAGGTCAIGSALFGLDRAGSAQQIVTVQLPRVEITARREVALAAPAATDVAIVELPRVEIVGRRAAALAAAEAIEATDVIDEAPVVRPAIAEASAAGTARVHPARAGAGETCIE